MVCVLHAARMCVYFLCVYACVLVCQCTHICACERAVVVQQT
jgi:hypothetical protein